MSWKSVETPLTNGMIKLESEHDCGYRVPIGSGEPYAKLDHEISELREVLLHELTATMDNPERAGCGCKELGEHINKRFLAVRLILGDKFMEGKTRHNFNPWRFDLDVALKQREVAQ